MRVVTLAVEGTADAAVARRLLRHAGLDVGPVHGQRGKSSLDARLGGYNAAARHAPWLVLRDLDHDASCAPSLARHLLPSAAPHMCFRVAVRKVESWLLADRESVGRFLAIPIDLIPLDPDVLDDPKAWMVKLADRSKRRGVRLDMVPVQAGSAQVGPAYTSRIIELASGSWRPDVAALHRPSLRSSLAALDRLRG